MQFLKFEFKLKIKKAEKLKKRGKDYFLTEYLIYFIILIFNNNNFLMSKLV